MTRLDLLAELLLQGLEEEDEAPSSRGPGLAKARHGDAHSAQTPANDTKRVAS